MTFKLIDIARVQGHWGYINLRDFQTKGQVLEYRIVNAVGKIIFDPGQGVVYGSSCKGYIKLASAKSVITRYRNRCKEEKTQPTYLRIDVYDINADPAEKIREIEY